jgi:hypothetical protein
MYHAMAFWWTNDRNSICISLTKPLRPPTMALFKNKIMLNSTVDKSALGASIDTVKKQNAK